MQRKSCATDYPKSNVDDEVLREAYDRVDKWRRKVLLEIGYHPIVDDLDLFMRNRQIHDTKYSQMLDEMEKRAVKFQELTAIRLEIEGYRSLLKPQDSTSAKKRQRK